MGKQIGIDLGTSYTRIYQKGKGIVLRQPSVVAIDKNSGNLIATGKDARKMLGKTPKNIEAYRPLKDGVIADIEVTTLMLNKYMRDLDMISAFNRPSVLIGVPYGVTTVEKNAVETAAYDSGAKNVATVPVPTAAAFGAGLLASDHHGHMIVDIGAGTTESAIINYGGIISASSLRVAGDAFDAAIVKYVRENFDLVISEVTAKNIKTAVGSAHPSADGRETQAVGRKCSDGFISSVTINSADVRLAIDEKLNQICNEITRIIEDAPPAVSADIFRSGIMLCGGSSFMPGILKRISEKTRIRVFLLSGGNFAPVDAVCNGIGCLMDHESGMKDMINYSR